MNAAPPSNAERHQPHGTGLALAIAAYTCWGLMPAYFKLLEAVDPVEIVADRILFSVPFCLIILALRGRLGELAEIARQPKLLGALAISALLIATNWLIFIVAVNSGHILSTSLGYYLNPLLTLMVGRLVLGERLTPMRRIAAVLAVAGVAVLLAGALDTLWISLTLAATFATYGLVRKLAPVGSVAGLTVETGLLLPLAGGAVIWFAASPSGGALFSDPGMASLLALAGVVTAVPLMMFAAAARRLPFYILGFAQYLAPTMTFLLGLFVYGEPFSPVKLISFILIWGGIALVSIEGLHAARRQRRADAQSYRMQ